MNVGTIVFLVILVVLIGGTTVLVARRPRKGGVELEPPKRPTKETAESPTAVVEAPPPEVDEATVHEIEEALTEAPPVEAPPEVLAPVKPSFRDRLAKARSAFSGAIGSVLSRSKIDDETWDDLEEALLRADVGIGLTTDLLDSVRSRVKDEGITEPEGLLEAVKAEMKSRLTGDRTLHFEPGVPNVWLFVGVNGVGKTTTIGKVGQREVAEGRSVVMAAGDTFRAAAA